MGVAQRAGAGIARHAHAAAGFDSDELPGFSVFYKDDAGDVFHTFCAYARGGEPRIGAYAFLDLTPKERDEAHNMMDWLRHHDRYDVIGSDAGKGAGAGAEGLHLRRERSTKRDTLATKLGSFIQVGDEHAYLDCGLRGLRMIRPPRAPYSRTWTGRDAQ
jgi:Bacterial protein of unknown function (DUF899)